MKFPIKPMLLYFLKAEALLTKAWFDGLGLFD